ncbi:MAG: hypothetical protein HQM06_13775 [Magnetococcales bacterium]|nr:hypothetical protein [Magnetococcales bacterium]
MPNPIRRWKSEKQRTRLPVVALTASALSGKEVRSRMAGCDHYPAKPVRKQHLLPLIRQLVWQAALAWRREPLFSRLEFESRVQFAKHFLV